LAQPLHPNIPSTPKQDLLQSPPHYCPQGGWRGYISSLDALATQRLGAAAIFIFAFVVRMSIFQYWKQLPLSGDELHYWNWARVAANGHPIHNYLHPPLWTYVLAAAAFISDTSVYARLITVIVSAFSAAAVYLLGKKVFGKRVGVLAGLVYSIYPNIVGFSHYLWSESFLALLVILSSLLFFKSLDGKTKTGWLYGSFLLLGFGLLVKEFAFISFLAMIITLAMAPCRKKLKVIVLSTLVFILPAAVYSCYASASAHRPVFLADAFVYNSNEADYGKSVWNNSTRENLHIFAGRILEIKNVPGRLVSQIANLWTPASFPIFRLISSAEGYRDVPHPRLFAFVALGAYILVIGSGLVGMCLSRHKAFLAYSLGTLFALTAMGFLFLMCSRFRVPFIHIFIIYGCVTWSTPRLKQQLTWRRGILLFALLAAFSAVLVTKRSAFGVWG
jgi:4-amino-4-deoxy-L-arabinose transferase-like glycosyltransferase